MLQGERNGKALRDKGLKEMLHVTEVAGGNTSPPHPAGLPPGGVSYRRETGEPYGSRYTESDPSIHDSCGDRERGRANLL